VLRRTRDGFAVDAAKPRGLDRPWSPAIADDPEPESILRPKPTVPHDATPAEADVQADD
jgi:competence protein ComEC